MSGHQMSAFGPGQLDHGKNLAVTPGNTIATTVDEFKLYNQFWR